MTEKACICPACSAQRVVLDVRETLRAALEREFAIVRRTDPRMEQAAREAIPIVAGSVLGVVCAPAPRNPLNDEAVHMVGVAAERVVNRILDEEAWRPPSVLH